HLRFCIAESNANAADKGESFFGLFGLMLIPRFAAFLPPQILDEEDQARRDERKQCNDCKQYAADAVQAGHDNRVLNCGNTGGRWSEDFDAHFNFCGANIGNSQPVNSENGARNRGLHKCKAELREKTCSTRGKTKMQLCDEYADAAAKAASFYDQSHCGSESTKSGRWSTTRDDHLAFCTWGFQRPDEANQALGGKSIIDVMNLETAARDKVV